MTPGALLRHRTRVALLLTATMTGCLLVSPLGEFEPAPVETGGASSGGRGGSDTGGGASGGAPEGGESGSTTGGTSGSAGSGGEPGECSTNAECASAVTGPGRCRDGTCVSLRSSDCFLVEGNPNDDDAVFLGAFASFYA
ncbi:MAG TPA: hypothetical protein VMS65_00005, partial [Polyangiaceae bacterium]|nr:hypothetical protein [Polyangiaceae bacterium]